MGKHLRELSSQISLTMQQCMYPPSHPQTHYYWIFENLLIPSQICIFLYILILFNANTIVLINRKVCNELNTTHGYFFNTSFVLISRISQKKIREIKTNDVLKKKPWVVLSSLHMLEPEPHLQISRKSTHWLY